MRLPKYPDETVIARDRYNNNITLHANLEGFDMSTDGRVYLSPQLAKRLAKKLIQFAETMMKR